MDAAARSGDANAQVAAAVEGLGTLVGLAGWVGVQDQRADSTGSERTEKINGRLMHEKTSQVGGDNEYGIVLGDRFIVAAKGRVDVSALRAAVSGLDLGKLEAMKDQGTQP